MQDPTVFLQKHDLIIDRLSYRNSTIYHEAINLVRDMYEKNDYGHKLNHAINVAIRAYAYAHKDHRYEILGEILAAGIFHDMVAHDRAEHHNLAADICLSDINFINFFEAYNLDKLTVSLAIRHHRASGPEIDWETFPVSHYIAAADRRVNLTELLNIMMGPECVITQDMVIYLYDKFNKDVGYAHMPPAVHVHRYKELCELYDATSTLQNITKSFNRRKEQMHFI